MCFTNLFPRSAAKGKPGDKRHTWLLNPRDKVTCVLCPSFATRRIKSRFFLASSLQNGRKPGDPDFDPTTLHVPREAWASFTPFEKQVGVFFCLHVGGRLRFILSHFLLLFSRS